MEDNLKSSVKDEPQDFGSRDTISQIKVEENGTPVIDYNKLYGDLYRKKITTPVTEIFPHMSATATTAAALPSSGSPLLSPISPLIHPAFAAFGAYALPTLGHPATALGAGAFGLLPTPGHDAAQLGLVKAEKQETDRHQASPEHAKDAVDDIFAEHTGHIDEDMDLEKLVDLFKDTLEKFGVSQRFAARFIMQDTSQGNLSFLMEKGKTRKWAELSPRGRLPYLRMKAWLESSEQQQYTLNLLKQSQDYRKSTPRESYSRRERFSMFQIHVLCRLFEENSNPPMNIRNAVAERLDIPLDRVNVWFQNQRARGFPARKFLEDRITDDPSTLNTISTPNSKRNSGPHRSVYAMDMTASSDAVANIMRRIPASSTTTAHNDEDTKPTKMTSPTSDIKNIQSTFVPEDDYQQPLDFSTKSLEGTSSLSSSSSSSIGALSDIVENMKPEKKSQFESSHREPNTNANVQMAGTLGTVCSSSTSGAAKRKRGLKPQHIVHRSAPDAKSADKTNIDSAYLTQEDQSSHSSKRLKLEIAQNIDVDNHNQSASIEDSECSKNFNIAQDQSRESRRNGKVENINSITDLSVKVKKHMPDKDTNKENHADKSNIKQVDNSKKDCSLTTASVETSLSAEETVALVHTLYTKTCMEKSSPNRSTLSEPDLD